MSGIDKAILKAENIALTGGDIKRIADDKINVLSYEDLEKYNNIDDVLGIHEATAILYQTSEKFGHWIGLFKTGQNSLEFYDPFGLKIDEELNIDNEFHLRLHQGKIVPHLTHLINQSDYKVHSNTKQLQKQLDHVNTCGRYVGFRIRMRDTKLKDFNDLLTKNKCYDADFWISSLTIFI